jgi:hypothetical protein
MPSEKSLGWLLRVVNLGTFGDLLFNKDTNEYGRRVHSAQDPEDRPQSGRSRDSVALIRHRLPGLPGHL